MDGLLRPPAPAREPEHVAEDVGEAAEDIVEARELVEAGAGETLVAVLVVDPSLLGVAQDLVGLGRLLESGLGLVITGVAVRMVPQRKLAVCLLDFLG